MASFRMALQWFHGRMENCSFGMQPARTLLLPPISQVLLARPEQWLPWRRSGRKTYYAHLDPSHSFTPVAVETSGVVGPQSLASLKDLGCWMRQVTGEERSLSYLLQRVSVAVQRGNLMLPQCWARLDWLSQILPSFLSSLLLNYFISVTFLFFFWRVYVSLACLCSVCFPLVYLLVL